MKHFVVLLSLALVFSVCEAQFNTPDSKDRSSLLNQPSSIGVDLEDAKLTIDFNNINSQHTYNPKWLVGVKYKGGAEEGASELFHEGDFVFGNELKGFIGVSFQKNTEEVKDLARLLASKESITKSSTKKSTEAVWNLIGEFRENNKKAVTPEQSNGIIINVFGTLDSINALELSKIEIKINDSTLNNFLSVYGFDNDLNSEVKKLFHAISKIIEAEKENQLSLVAFKSIYENEIYSIQRQEGIPIITIFLNGSVSGYTFNLLDTLGAGSYKMIKQSFRGGHFGVGANARFSGRMYIGVLYNFDWTDNFSDLDELTYSIVQRDTIGGSLYDLKSELTAYTGEYQTYHRHTIGIDYVNMFSFSDMSRLALNAPYLRLNALTGLADAKTTFDIGLSANFYKSKGKFLFGIYAELVDLADAYETGENAFKRLTLGFRVNYAIRTELDN